MLDPKHLDDLAQRLSGSLPKGLQALQEDINRNLRAAMEKDLHQLEASADQPAVLENFTKLPRFGIGADVKILRGFAKVEVPDTAAHQVGDMSGITKTVEDFQRFPVNIFPGYKVI